MVALRYATPSSAGRLNNYNWWQKIRIGGTLVIINRVKAVKTRINTKL